MRDFLPNALDNAFQIAKRRPAQSSNDSLIGEVEEDLKRALTLQLKNIISKDDELKKLNIDPSDFVALSQAIDSSTEARTAADFESTSKTSSNSEYKRQKNKKKKERGKLRKSNINQNEPNESNIAEVEQTNQEPKLEDENVIEYYQEKEEFNPLDKEFGHLMNVYNTFKLNNDIITNKKTKESEPRESGSTNEEKEDIDYQHLSLKPRGYVIEDDEDDDNLLNGIGADGKPKKLTKKQIKNKHRMSCAQLKYFVNRPDIVEMHDGNSPDPLLLIHLKSLRNTVPVPLHWSYKRRYLSTQREHNKGFFELPDFIKSTGIQEIREALQSKEASKSLKAKMRGHVRPKTGKLDIDYQRLHDAFFKNQTKPFMTSHGDLYYEGKEFKTKMQKKQPGVLSNELRIALGMPIGPEAHKCPPPWLIAQQRYGPPPSYPGLKIPGLNHPIPDTCQFGYHAGGWGKPPVNENGKPLYGDVFGIGQDHVQQVVNPPLPEDAPNFDINELWGDFVSSDESFMEEEEEQQEEDELSVKGILTPSEGIVTPSGTYSTQSILSNIELSKAGGRSEIDEDKSREKMPQTLYTVLPEKKVNVQSDQFVGTSHVYDVSSIVKPDSQGIETTTEEDGSQNYTKVLPSVQKSAKGLKKDKDDIEEDDVDDLNSINKKKFKF